MINNLQGSLFSAPQDSYLVHACNSRGVWGAGVAKEFAERFPTSHREYQSACKEYQLGNAIILGRENFYHIVCLITSDGYGREVDPPETILKYTTSAIRAFLRRVKFDVSIHSGKFNSGLFKVPWEDTLKVVDYLAGRYGVTWNVWTPQRK